MLSLFYHHDFYCTEAGLLKNYVGRFGVLPQKFLILFIGLLLMPKLDYINLFAENLLHPPSKKFPQQWTMM